MPPLPWPPPHWRFDEQPVTPPWATALPTPIIQVATPDLPPAQRLARPGDPDLAYHTKLTPKEERAFQSWITTNKVPFDPGPQGDYDMRGFWQALQAKDPRAATAVSPTDKQLHFPDIWKTPYHATFSDESIYATPDAPHWDGDVLIAKDGRVVADERPEAQRKAAK